MEQNNLDKIKEHYYGDSIRVIFIVSGIVMLCSFPFFSSLVGLPAIVSIIGIMVLVVLGGLLSPVSRWVFVVSSIVPMAGFALFEYYAYYAYTNLSSLVPTHVYFFWVNQFLALMFFFATYLSIKTLRGMIQSK
jgi:phosphatidylserine synthase